ncbi:MAG: nitrate ABC transporter permease [Serpentinimonas sp.]|nr:nitrate ABC transporter permease [Serpentinimonas sp.]
MRALNSLNARAAVVSLFLLFVFVGIWQLSTTGPTIGAAATNLTADELEYLKMMGQDPGAVKSSGFPSPMEVAKASWGHLTNPFYDNGPNDKGIGIQLLHSLGRVAMGFALAVMVALPLGFAIGMSPLMRKSFDPFVQVLKPISPLAWMPLALYTLKDSNVSGVFVIFICSVWPMLINTAFGVASVKREWLNVALTLEVSPIRKAFKVILPAAAPTILTGMRISMGIAWLVIVAAEMLVGGTGIGYFVWNEWNNLSLTNVIFAIVTIGLVGMFLDQMFGLLQKAVTYVE